MIDAGIPVVVAAGNDTVDAKYASPARVPAAITVAASTKAGNRAGFSNYGSLIDIFAPGNDVLSAAANSSTATVRLSGTSMAAPHVSGGIARYLQAHPKATPAQVRAALVGDSSRNALRNLEGSPNRLLYLRRNVTGAPVAVVTSHSSRKITVKWSAPYGFATWAVTRYQVTRSGRDAGGHAFSRTSVASSARSYTFTDLKRSTRYRVSVRAVNAAGASSSSAVKVTTSR